MNNGGIRINFAIIIFLLFAATMIVYILTLQKMYIICKSSNTIDDSPTVAYAIANSDMTAFCTISNTLDEYHSPGGEVVINDNISAIGPNAFNGVRLRSIDTIVTSIYIPDSVTWIGQHAFFATTAKTIRLSNELRYIGAEAFAESKDIEKIYFDVVPTHCVDIDKTAFCGCPNVELVNFPNNISLDENGYVVEK